MTVVFPWQQAAKPMTELPCTTRTFPGDVWQEAQSAVHAELSAEVMADARAIADAERVRTRLHDALRAAVDPIRIVCLGGIAVHGRVREVGVDFVVIGLAEQRLAAVRLPAIARVRGLGQALRAEPGIDAPDDQGPSLMHWLRIQGVDAGSRLEIVAADGWCCNAEMSGAGADFIRFVEQDETTTTMPLEAIAVITLPEIPPAGHR
ncbi:MAG: hypothetical protein WC005_06705 [Candidatus Nanopelagicales bacterium]